MNTQNETELETPVKTRVRITTLKNRSTRIEAIRIALIQQESKNVLTEEAADKIMEEGCRKLEKELGLETAA